MQYDAPRPGLVLPVRLDPTGGTGPTRGQARGKSWRRTSHGFYVPASVDPAVVEQRIVDASVVVPSTGAITGWAALRWRGGVWFDGTTASGGRLPVDILIGTHDIRNQPGIAVCGESTAPDRFSTVDGLTVVEPRWAVAFMMRRALTPWAAVIALDMAAYSDLVSLTEARETLARLSSWTGIPQARDALPWAVENSWSPAETVMRLVWSLEGGFRSPRPNAPVFDRTGQHLGTPDLIDPVAGVIGEYDSVLHLERGQRVVDVQREARFRDHGLEVVSWMAGDSRQSFLERLSSAYQRAGRRGAAGAWTLEAPPWWVSTDTVTARRGLTADQRARFLRYRIA